jgi:hypothetical protein
MAPPASRESTVGANECLLNERINEWMNRRKQGRKERGLKIVWIPFQAYPDLTI